MPLHRHAFLHALVLLAGLGAVACSSGSSSGDDVGGGGAGGADGARTEDGDPGLLGCGLPQACETIRTHIDEYPADAPYCAAELITAGDAGVLVHRYEPGPADCFREHIYIFLGDGTAIHQWREKEDCSGYEPDHFYGDAYPQELCKVAVPQELITNCESGAPVGVHTEGCKTLPGDHLIECQPIEQLTCAEALALIQP